MDRQDRKAFNPDGIDRAQEPDEWPDFPLADADRCVKCALCLPHCPTYRLSREESESPRGRIALMQAVAQGELEPSERLAGHLERCLGCRNCEPVCPADVPYGRLIDAGQAMLAARGRRRRSEEFAARALASPGWLRGIGLMARLYQYTGLQWLAEASLLRLAPPLRRLSRLLPALPRHRRWPQEAGQGEPVQLFLGCLADELDPGVTEATLQLLCAAGHEVRIPASQGCCGAPDQHGGRPECARRLAQRNVETFAGQDPILATASGCTATLLEYPELRSDAEHADFSNRVRDICGYLLERGPSGFDLRPLHARALVHVPCSQRNVVGSAQAPEAISRWIPGLDVATLESKGQCCGAAGSYIVSQPKNSDALGAGLAERVLRERPDYLLTTNIGCKLQLKAHLKAAGSPIVVLHPVELLARQLQARTNSSEVPKS